MAITYPVDVVNTRWAVYQVSTGEIIDRNKVWPVADGSEIQGLDPDYVYLLHVNDARPDYDSRIYILTGTEGIDVTANTLHLSWETVRRALDELTTAAENEEAAQLALHISLAREVVLNRLVIGAMAFYVFDNQALPPKALAMVNNYKAKALKLWRNRDRLDEIIAALEAGETPNMDEGWEAP